MLIGIDARFAIGKRRGIGNYSLGLIQNLAEIDGINEYFLYVDKKDMENVLPQKNNFRTKRLYPSNYLVWEQVMLPLQAKKDKLDILHCTGNTAPICLCDKIKLISTIHDISYLKSYSVVPKSGYLYQKIGRIYRKNIVPISLKRVDRVITVSQFAKKDMLENLQIFLEKKITVTYLGTGDLFKPVPKEDAKSFVKSRFGIKNEFILNIGGVDPQKNTKFIVENLLKLKEEENIVEKIVIVGFSNWQTTEICKLLQKSKFREDFIFIGFIEGKDIVCLYNAASVFIFPSLYESFGIPPLEAMACGTPVITSKTGAIPEITGRAALLIEPRAGEQLRSALLKVLNDKNLRNELIARGLEQVKKFSWRKMAEETLEIYKSVCFE